MQRGEVAERGRGAEVLSEEGEEGGEVAAIGLAGPRARPSFAAQMGEVGEAGLFGGGAGAGHGGQSAPGR